MAKVTIQGKEYDLFLGLYAMEQIENKYGDMKTALEQFRKDRKIGTVKDFFVAMANNGRKKAKLPMDVTAEELDVFSLADLSAISKAMSQALDEGARTEVVGGGEADDEAYDALAAEYDEKNG